MVEKISSIESSPNTPPVILRLYPGQVATLAKEAKHLFARLYAEGLLIREEEDRPGLRLRASIDKLPPILDAVPSAEKQVFAEAIQGDLTSRGTLDSLTADYADAVFRTYTGVAPAHELSEIQSHVQLALKQHYAVRKLNDIYHALPLVVMPRDEYMRHRTEIDYLDTYTLPTRQTVNLGELQRIKAANQLQLPNRDRDPLATVSLRRLQQ